MEVSYQPEYLLSQRVFFNKKNKKTYGMVKRESLLKVIDRWSLVGDTVER